MDSTISKQRVFFLQILNGNSFVILARCQFKARGESPKQGVTHPVSAVRGAVKPMTRREMLPAWPLDALKKARPP